MKNILLLIFLFPFFPSYAQLGFPNFIMNPVWEMTFQTDILTTDVSVELGTDTLFCGEIWTPIYQIDDSDYFNEHIGFFREEGPKVFVRKSVDCTENEYLMYDFSAEAGDTLWCGFDINFPQYNPVPIVVGAAQTEIFNGVARKIIFATYKPAPFALPIQFQWVEGVGDLVHPFYSLNCYPYLCGELEYYFHCMYVDESLAFSNPFGIQPCESPNNTLDSNSDLNFEIHPNPFKDELFLKWNGNFEPDYLIIYDALGKVVFETEDLSKQHLELSNLSSGVYFFMLKKSKQQIIKKIIKK